MWSLRPETFGCIPLTAFESFRHSSGAKHCSLDATSRPATRARRSTMQGVTTTRTGAIFYMPAVATGPLGTLAGQFTTHYGFDQMTGTVFAQQTTGTGGAGHLHRDGKRRAYAVRGGTLARRLWALLPQQPGGRDYVSSPKVALTLGAPIPSLSPTWIAAAAAKLLTPPVRPGLDHRQRRGSLGQ